MAHWKGLGFTCRVAALAFTSALVAVALSSCKGFFSAVNLNGTGTATSSYAYVSNTGGTLAEYGLSSSGLSSLTGSPITLPVAATSITVSPNNEFLYVGTGTGVFLYTISTDGSLTEGNDDTVIYLNQTIGSPVIESMVVDSTNSWLILAYENSTEIDALPIDPSSGLPTATSPFIVTSTFATPNPQLAISKANTQVFVALGTGGVEAFGFAPTTDSKTPWGSSVSIPLYGTNASDNAVAVDPTSKYLFIAEANNTTTTSAGTVRMIATADLTASKDVDDEPTGVGPSSVLADLSGAYVYVANETDGTLSGFTIDTTSSKLTSLGAAFPSEQSPIALVEDNSKTFVLNVGNQNNPNLWVYNFDGSTAGLLDIKTTASTASTNPALANAIAVTH